jgi:Na+-driven multidrug efflux pump
VLFLLIPWAASAFHLSPGASAMCVQVVRWFDVFSLFFWALSFTLPNVLRSGGDTKYTMAVSSVSMWLFRVILSYFFVRQCNMGLLGVWLGMFVDWIFRDLMFVVRFRNGKWLNHKII